MTVTATPIFPQAINVGVQTIVNADAQAQKTLFTAGTNGSKVESISISSSDTSARDVSIYLTRSATNYLLSTVSIPAGAGQPAAPAATPAVDILRSAQIPGLAYDPNGNHYLYLMSGDTLTISAPVTITSAKTVTAVASGGNF